MKKFLVAAGLMAAFAAGFAVRGVVPNAAQRPAVASVELRGIPPMGDGVEERRRHPGRAGRPARVGRGRMNAHRAMGFPPPVVSLDGYFDIV